VVQSVKETLSSQFVENCQGVVQRLTLQEGVERHRPALVQWECPEPAPRAGSVTGALTLCMVGNDYEKLIHQRTNTTPFQLLSAEEDAPGVAVRVMKPLEASELSLETVYEKFHPSIQSFTDVLGHYLSGERPKGIQETEEMLRVGTALTGVGELLLEHGTLRLQPPKQGLPYYLSASPFDALLQKQEANVRFWKTLTLLFGLATCAVLFFVLRRHYRDRLQRRRLRQMREEFRQAQELLLRRAGPEGAETLKNVCVVCWNNPKSCVFLECGHLCSCRECYRALPEPKRCPVCRQDISRAVPLYNSSPPPGGGVDFGHRSCLW
ncbi:PREDICTED: mitochondrial ubiquitin ligase activator of NFKB 1, partial [Merops nubicus]|uniref:mitochondrial ubiquitin ligase activator of NFKB 1 n=1 Tax=Merops nubicus TaxID=57421 RepID=UPI0004F08FC6